jgi:uncharacterized protein DUF3224
MSEETATMSESRSTATAQIAVSVWAPEPYDEPADGPALVRIHVEETFTGDLEGDGVATMLQVLRSDGSALFCALERVSGTLAGRAGTFVLQDTGELAVDGHVVGSWFVVAGSGTGELAGLRGEGGFDAQLGQHAKARIDYWFE